MIPGHPGACPGRFERAPWDSGSRSSSPEPSASTSPTPSPCRDRPASVSVNEPDGTNSYTIALSSQPTGNVVVAVASDDTSVATVSPASLTFTSTNWNTRQEVTVTAVDDDLATPAVRTTAITHTASGANFNGVSAQVTVQVVNDDQAAFRAGSGAYVINGGEDNQVVMPIWITSEPTGDVTVTLSVEDETVASVSPASVTFTPANWRDRVDITISGVANDVHDPDHRMTSISFTVSGADYDGMTRPAVSVTVTDDDQRTFRVTDHSFAVSENGGRRVLSIWITSEPTGNVTVTLASQDTSVATVSPTSVTFTPSNWKQQAEVTVTAVDDDIYNRPQRRTQIVVTISGADYDMVTTSPIRVTAADDEPVPVAVPEGRAFSYGLRTTLRQGEGSVSLEVTSSDPEVVAIDPETRILTWTEAASGTEMRVRASTVDNDALGNGFATISHRYTQPRDPDIPPVQGLAITVTDDDVPAVTVAPTDLLVVTGATRTYSVVLDVEPNADVTVTASSGNAGVAAVSPASLTFTPSDWNVAQTVTVTGVGAGSAAISHGASGGGYDGAAIDDVAVTVVDSLKRMDVTTSATHDEITLTWPRVEGAAGYELEIQGPGVFRTSKTTARRKAWRGLSPNTPYDLRAIPLTGLGQDGSHVTGYLWWEGTETTTGRAGRARPGVQPDRRAGGRGLDGGLHGGAGDPAGRRGTRVDHRHGPRDRRWSGVAGVHDGELEHGADGDGDGGPGFEHDLGDGDIDAHGGGRRLRRRDRRRNGAHERRRHQAAAGEPPAHGDGVVQPLQGGPGWGGASDGVGVGPGRRPAELHVERAAGRLQRSRQRRDGVLAGAGRHRDRPGPNPGLRRPGRYGVGRRDRRGRPVQPSAREEPAAHGDGVVRPLHGGSGWGGASDGVGIGPGRRPVDLLVERATGRFHGSRRRRYGALAGAGRHRAGHDPNRGLRRPGRYGVRRRDRQGRPVQPAAHGDGGVRPLHGGSGWRGASDGVGVGPGR